MQAVAGLACKGSDPWAWLATGGQSSLGQSGAYRARGGSRLGREPELDVGNGTGDSSSSNSHRREKGLCKEAASGPAMKGQLARLAPEPILAYLHKY